MRKKASTYTKKSAIVIVTTKEDQKLHFPSFLADKVLNVVKYSGHMLRSYLIFVMMIMMMMK